MSTAATFAAALLILAQTLSLIVGAYFVRRKRLLPKINPPATKLEISKK